MNENSLAGGHTGGVPQCKITRNKHGGRGASFFELCLRGLGRKR
jgi:hypothetical protein